MWYIGWSHRHDKVKDRVGEVKGPSKKLKEV